MKFFLLFLLFISLVSASAAHRLQYLDASVSLTADWQAADTIYSSVINYKFCTVIPANARVVFKDVQSIRFVHLLSDIHVQFDKTLMLTDNRLDQGCLMGSVKLNDPYRELKSTERLVVDLIERGKTKYKLL